MAKPTIITRAGKGSALTWTEGDANLTNLRDATITVSDGTNSKDLNLNDTLTFTAGTNISLSVNSSTGAVTVNNSMTAFNPASPGAIGGTTPSTGAFTTLAATATTTSGAINVTYNPTATSGSAIQVTGKDSQGGTGYLDFFKATNTTSGVTNGSKTFRLNSTGAMEVINNAYSATIFSLSDTGILTTNAIVSSGALSFKDTREAIYDLGTTGGTVAPNVANGSVQKITLNSALTLNAFTSPIAGQSLTLIIYGGTSYTSITSTMKFAGGVKTLTGTAGCIDILSIYYDGTNYFASLNKGFA